jgi:hypothetical protein
MNCRWVQGYTLRYAIRNSEADEALLSVRTGRRAVMPRLSAMAFAVATLIALPGLGHAGQATSGIRNADTLEVGAARRHRPHHWRGRSTSTRFTVRPAYRYGWRERPPYGPHPSDLASDSRPYFVPGAPKFSYGLRHDGFGTGAYGFGYQ